MNAKYKEFNKLTTDKQRWTWVLMNRDIVTIYLNNDCTFGVLDDYGEQDEHTLNFDDSLGWDDGAITLLDAFGIKLK